jgi:hypothetical protein
VQASWVKLGRDGAVAALAAGADDLGGTLMDESISRAAGAQHGPALSVRELRSLIEDAGRQPRQRDTLYRDASPERQACGARAPSGTVGRGECVPQQEGTPTRAFGRNPPQSTPALAPAPRHTHPAMLRGPHAP